MSPSATGDTEGVTEEALKKLKVPELKELCKTKKLPVSGTKPVLIARLLGQPAPAAAPSNKRKKDASTSDASTPSTSGVQASNPDSETTSSVSQADATTAAPRAKVQKGKTKARPNDQSSSKAAQPDQKNASDGLADIARDDAPSPMPAKKKAKIAPATAEPSNKKAAAPNKPVNNPSAIATVPSTPTASTSSIPRVAPFPQAISTATTANLALSANASSSPTLKSATSAMPVVAVTHIQAALPAHPTETRRTMPAFAVPKPKASNTGHTVTGSSAVADTNATIPTRSTARNVGSSSKTPAAYAAARPPAKIFKTLVPARQPLPNEPGTHSRSLTSLLPGLESVLADSKSLLQSYGWLASLFGKNSLSSFLPKAILTHEKQLPVALAYLITKLYTLIGTAEDLAILQSAIKDLPSITQIEYCTQDVSLVTCSDSTRHHVLNASGEIIGTEANGSPTSTSPFHSGISELVVRSDWKAYLVEKEASLESDSISSLIRSPDEESFVHGISKHWLAVLGRMNDGDEARMRLAAAQAYVICHVAPNAVSGSWQTLSDQQAEFSGSGGGSTAARVRKPKVSLFLPICHQVESVSLEGLHPSIAQIQTSSRAHYTLRLTGQSIGEEDEGILPVFQDMIKCDSRGRPLYP